MSSFSHEKDLVNKHSDEEDEKANPKKNKRLSVMVSAFDNEKITEETQSLENEIEGLSEESYTEEINEINVIDEMDDLNLKVSLSKPMDFKRPAPSTFAMLGSSGKNLASM